MCFVKHLPVSSALDAVREMEPFVKSGDVIGLGADSSEVNNPRELPSPAHGIRSEMLKLKRSTSLSLQVRRDLLTRSRAVVPEFDDALWRGRSGRLGPPDRL